MSTIETIAGDKDLEIVGHFATKLGFEQEQVDMFGAVLDTIEEILEKKARPNIFDWENEGAKLTEEGKVVLPGNMQDVLDEIVKENEIYTWFVPEDLGGYGYTNVFQAALSELFSRYDISLHISAFIGLSVLEALTVYFTDNFQEPLNRFMSGDNTGYVAFTEAQAGSNLENVKATVELDGDEYILNGTKIFISNGGHANAGLFLGKNIKDGKEEGTNVVFVEGLEGITTERLEEKSGLHANPTAQLHFENVRVPKENIIYKEGEGYKKVLERLMGMRLGVAMQGVGAARRSLELAKQYSEERVQFGRPIKEFSGVSRKLDAIEAAISRMRAYSYQSAYALDRYYKGYIPAEVGATGDSSEKMAANNFPSPVLTGLAHYYISSAKLYTSELANYISYDAQQIFGGNGFVSEFEINKIARDVRVLNVYEGTSEIHEFIISKAQDAINMLPKFERLSARWDEQTMYDRILYARFPDLVDKI